ncbi:MAG: tRNA (guanosine(46)-N7)-methyltransferase TrmB [Flavobacteriaceae bacterium]|nr:tRNA (guanosine(46)-N7)-methyltransferase TrmB [Flavobacteriaceae bacterium]MCY4217471.1 tRNA (guanosine(46)-N7)-methyltransferase TrmB [Flavobacteriaceae bacterium]MCY4253185.1 tRNA (guanosine(46)-N7)-methyltransferase TrmB [Flavobacteriaceae bacterium]
MGKKNKKRKIQENLSFENLLQDPFPWDRSEAYYLKGQWNKQYFKNSYPIWLELGCGKGEYTLYNAIEFPKINHIGIDIKGTRIWRGAKTANQQQIDNVAFLRCPIQYIEHYFDENEVNQLWIIFPDPQDKYRQTKHRLTNKRFLDRYLKILKPNNRIYLKTDSNFLFGYTLGVLENYRCKIHQVINDVHQSQQSPAFAKDVVTFYERIFINENKSIKFLCFELLK